METKKLTSTYNYLKSLFLNSLKLKNYAISQLSLLDKLYLFKYILLFKRLEALEENSIKCVDSKEQLYDLKDNSNLVNDFRVDKLVAFELFNKFYKAKNQEEIEFVMKLVKEKSQKFYQRLGNVELKDYKRQVDKEQAIQLLDDVFDKEQVELIINESLLFESIDCSILIQKKTCKCVDLNKKFSYNYKNKFRK